MHKPHSSRDRSAPLLSLFSTIRLSAALEARKSGGLEAIEALLGCPLNLFEMVNLRGSFGVGKNAGPLYGQTSPLCIPEGGWCGIKNQLKQSVCTSLPLDNRCWLTHASSAG